MKISARNQIKATVASMTTGMVNARLTLLTSKGVKLSSVITSESTKEMSLKEGDTVTAFFKATHVMLSTAHIDGISARNQLEGTIENVVKGGGVFRGVYERQRPYGDFGFWRVWMQYR